MKQAIKGLYASVKAENPELPKFMMWLIFVVKLIIYGIGFLFLLGFLCALQKGVNQANYERRKYPANRYRKVVKEGLFWDTTEWHER